MYIKLVEKNSKMLIKNQVIKNIDQLRATQSPYLFLPFFIYKKIEDSISVRGNSSYRMRSILFRDQNE